MTSKEIVRKIMYDKRISQERLARECGLKRQTNVSNALNSGASMRVDSLEQFVSAMGYEIVIREIGSETGGMVVHEVKIGNDNRE